MATIAIVVLYNDNTQEAENNITKLSKQVDRIYLIDNSANSYEERFCKWENVIYLPQHKNLGIATAQNIGLKYALAEKPGLIAFADPDSSIPDNAIKALTNKYLLLKEWDNEIGGIGSSAFDLLTGRPISTYPNLIRRVSHFKVNQLTYLMNSISLIPAKLFEEVGLMCESLFIDDVDCEWCWRATSKKGVHFYQDREVVIYHKLGKSSRKIGKRSISIGSSNRLFYQYRNYLWLFKKKYVPKKWLLYNGGKYIIKLFYYPLFVTPRFKNLINILLGINKGIKTK